MSDAPAIGIDLGTTYRQVLLLKHCLIFTVQIPRCLRHGRRPFRRTADFFWMFCSCVGVWQNDRVEIIANDQGNRTTPSYVGFTDTERLIGDAAKNQVAMNPRNTVFDAKRLIGRKFDDTAVQQDMKHWPFAVIKGPDGKPIIEGKCCSPMLLAGVIRIQVAHCPATAACPFLKKCCVL